MGVFDVILKRRSIRRYRKGSLSKEQILRLLEAARWAPSAKNLQPWHFIVVVEDELKEKLAYACKYQEFIKDAACIIVGLADKVLSPKWCIVDTTIALEHIVLTAHEMGLGTCWIGAFDESKVKEILGIPERYKVVALITIGFPDETPPPRPRKGIEEISSLNYFGNPIRHLGGK